MNGISFVKKKPNKQNLLSYGFVKQEEAYLYSCDIAGGQMRMTVTVKQDGTVSSSITDLLDCEEYVLHRVAGAEGSFVGQVRTDREAVLAEISARCFDSAVFESEQTNAVIDYARETYGDELEFLWKKFPDYAVLRRKDNQKWYAAVLKVSRRKLGLDSDEPVEILDLRLHPEEMERTVDHIRYFPGYHMNKKHWITICMDHSIPLEDIFRRIDDSYSLTK